MANSDNNAEAIDAEWETIRGQISRVVVAMVETSENREALLPRAQELLYTRSLRKAVKAGDLPAPQATVA